MDGQTPRKSWKRRLVRALALCLILSAAALGALPWLLGTPPVRSALVGAVNRAIAPSRVAIRGVSASWVGPIRLTGVSLRDGRGKVLIDAKSAALDRGLIALARDPSRLGTITVEGAAVDVERRADGSIDLVEALVPPSPKAEAPDEAPKPTTTSGRPGVSVTIRVVEGSLRLSTPELAEPLVAGKLGLEAVLPAEADRPLSWKVRLAEPPGGSASETLGVDGTFDLNAPVNPDLSLAVKGERWPLALAGATLGADLSARTRLDGTLTLARKAGQWSAAGDARLLDLDATGPALAGDRLRLDQVVAAWDLAQTANAWQVSKIDVQSPVAIVTGHASVGSDGTVPAAKLEASFDLAALAGRVPHVLRLRDGLTLERGSARLSVDVATAGDTQTGSATLKLTELTARDAARAFTLHDPLTVDARATRSPTGFSVQALAVNATFLKLNGSGDLERGLTLSGSLDLGALEAQFRDLIDFGGLKLAGTGRIAADYRKAKAPPAGKTGTGFVARSAVEVRGLKVAGLSADPVERDAVRLDAVVTGPADGSGAPQGWENLRFNLKSSRDAVLVGASNRGGTTTVSASASVPWTLSQRDGVASAVAVGRWTPGPGSGQGVAEFDQLRLSLRPADPALAADGTLALAVRGRLDLTAGNLTLTPLPSAATPALGLAPEGLTLHGLQASLAAGHTAQLKLVGDLGMLDRALAVWSAQPANGLAGKFSAQVALSPGKPGQPGFGLVVSAPDVSRPRSDGKSRQPEGPLTLACNGTYDLGGNRVNLEGFGLVTRYGHVTATGRIDEPGGRLVADLQGALTPNWPALSALATESAGSAVQLAGGPRPYRVKGPLSGASLAGVLKGLDAEVGLDLASADAFGLKLGPAPLVVRCGGGKVAIDPVHTTMNGGKVDLLPGLDVDEARGIALTLAKGSALDGVVINDEVSRAVLSYVAPVLDKATHVNGKVAMTVDGADIPLASCPPDRRLNLTGQLVFQDVVFAPGPFAEEVLTLAGPKTARGVRLHQPVQLAVADGRVIQKGLEVPIAQGSKVALEGSVGFDQTLDLKASVPLTKALLGPAGGLGANLDGLVDGRTVVVPIGGTVEHPRVNRQALQVALKQLSRDVLKGGLSREASGLLDRVAPPAGNGQGSPPRGRSDPLKGLENELLRRLAPRGNGGDAPPNPQP
jgi:translocation and assembly module TamB